MISSAAQDEYNELFRDKDRDTQHPEDRDHDSDGDESEKEERYYEIDDNDTDDELDIPKDSNMRSNNYVLPSIRSEANTGPKGVIADAAAFEKAKKQARRFTWKKQQQPQSYTVTAYHDEKLSSDEEEDGFMKQWREARLRELQNAGQRIRSRTTSPSRRIYGNMPAVDGEGFLEAIEKVARDTVVVVFVYDDTISAMVEEQMREVARRNDTTRFVKLHYEDAEMEVAGVPAVIAYKSAEKFAGLVPLMDELPEDSELTAVSLETVFRR
ncbi:thioredoxin-like protein [Bimuria novae-zelandiae CBS 107.79]|uniref:Thioredoxin-like protein n=1 Tax=Bimuria novae-zelandiae CBS 107.79 TaxID=1447943 RepID=A0A6A5VD51_9PLEO|nr:thioredoxin-like protein [Bimuria novae-zelandiae CBS 107.79]